ncbi:MAG TPA: FHA domain-containing protein [Telluria sp.]|nr:FHA domain-containing protein [Telluria sp.]
MAKIIISQGAQVVQEVELDKERTTIGRHPQNDVVIEHLAVSGRHAAITLVMDDAILEDLGSTNGTYVNGQRIARHQLSDRDRVNVGTFKIDYIVGARVLAPQPAVAAAPAPAVPLPLGSIEVLNGANAGKKLTLAKPLTTLGSPGVLVVVIQRQATGYFISHIEGTVSGQVNGEAIAKQPRLLADGDALELTGTAMRFSLAANG